MRMATESCMNPSTASVPQLARSVELLHDQERFESMLGDLLEISRFDAGAADLTTDDVDLGDLVEAIMLSRRWPPRGGFPNSYCTVPDTLRGRGGRRKYNTSSATCSATPSATANTGRSPSRSPVTCGPWR